MTAALHKSVMVAEVLDVLAPQDGSIYVDGTFGAGGYSQALLDAADCRVIAIDRDPGVIAHAESLARQSGDRLVFRLGRFGDMEQLVQADERPVDGIAFDLGVSSMQLDQAERGFSFAADGPLDMRMGTDGPSAADVVNTLPEAELADIFWRYGEERRSRRAARAIAEARAEEPIQRTGQLAEIVRRAVGRSRTQKIDPATRVFQALRIYVNDELGELDRGLVAAERLLRPGGRLAVVSFHSLEDRKVKSFLNARSGAGPKPSRHLPSSDRNTPAPTFHPMFRRAQPPGTEEVRVNPRARSARLRAAIRTDAPPWQDDPRHKEAA
ncbi:MAG: 16S rRNA (cytosine(1402)-N(4))-methyltransferase RsmH [Alphaproteobacteria bacterium]|nr:16S rRNA (cytosine(1402)-N(4))-methyltransferase RsmH [Alphaproteobacteria bacterium]